MERPWNHINIDECSESLENIPSLIYCLEPHPYISLGAPYPNGTSPWKLRSQVITLLVKAQEILQGEFPSLQLAVFDAYRPISVQSFMIQYSINQECLKRGLDRLKIDHTREVDKVIKDVSRFWAEPSLDPLTPPPHSTGGAIDITLAYVNGTKLEMGGDIDLIGPISEPEYYALKALEDPNSNEFLWHSRRCILAKTLNNLGFVQHPNEWWHFSYGDQLWAWKRKLSHAIYGGIFPHS